MAMIYELTQQFKIELCRPFGACKERASRIRRVPPYANLCRPFGACMGKRSPDKSACKHLRTWTAPVKGRKI